MRQQPAAVSFDAAAEVDDDLLDRRSVPLAGTARVRPDSPDVSRATPGRRRLA